MTQVSVYLMDGPPLALEDTVCQRLLDNPEQAALILANVLGTIPAALKTQWITASLLLVSWIHEGTLASPITRALNSDSPENPCRGLWASSEYLCLIYTHIPTGRLSLRQFADCFSPQDLFLHGLAVPIGLTQSGLRWYVPLYECSGGACECHQSYYAPVKTLYFSVNSLDQLELNVDNDRILYLNRLPEESKSQVHQRKVKRS